MDAILAALEALAEQKSAQGGQPSPLAAFMRPAPPPSRPPTPPVQPPVAPAAVQAPAAAPAHAAPPNLKSHPLQGMFTDGNSLLRAIIAAEVLGPPVAFKEHTPWNQQPNEPST